MISRQIANAHTTFNVVMTIFWIPLIWLLVKIVMIIVPRGKKEQADITQPLFLDNKLINQPAAALQLVAKEVIHCSDVVGDILNDIVKLVKKEDIRLIVSLREKDKVVRSLDDRITEYLADMFSAGVLTEEQATQTAGIMYVLSDIDRIGMLCGNVVDSVEDKINKKYKYSKDAMKDLEKSLSVIEEMYSQAMQAMRTGDLEHAKKIQKRKEKVLDLDINMRKAHMNRVGKGKCAAKLTAPFNKILHCIDRMGNSCVNIADAALGQVDFNYFIHTGENEEAIQK